MGDNGRVGAHHQHGHTGQPVRTDLRRFAWLAVAAALATIGLKLAAYAVTGSVGLLSDAAESVVNLVAAVVALVALSVAMRPADDAHHFGHGKAEYFSAVVEGAMILLAAAGIVWTSVDRLLDPQPLDDVGVGLAIALAASALNGVVAWVLIRAGRRHRSITLTADGRHLLTDLWTSIGVVVGVLLVALTGWERLDPIVALLVGLNILRTGWHLVRSSVDGLMDTAPDDETLARIHEAVAGFGSPQVEVHDVRARVAGRQTFVSLHVLVPSVWTVGHGHDLCEAIEQALDAAVPGSVTSTHLEPREDAVDCSAHLDPLPTR